MNLPFDYYYVGTLAVCLYFACVAISEFFLVRRVLNRRLRRDDYERVQQVLPAIREERVPQLLFAGLLLYFAAFLVSHFIPTPDWMTALLLLLTAARLISLMMLVRAVKIANQFAARR